MSMSLSMPTDVPGDLSDQEISSQAQGWSELIPLILQQSGAVQEIFSGIEEVIFAGCGTSLNVSFSAASLFQNLAGVPARAVPAAETYLFPETFWNPGRRALAVLLSRSGQTTEVVQAMEFLNRQGVPTIGLTCAGESPLAKGSQLRLVLEPVNERAVATTRSATGMILAAQLLAGIVSGNARFLGELHSLPKVCAAKISLFHDLGRQIGERTGLVRYAFVGQGPFFGLARESQLKIKEMALLPVDAYPTLDFRHGPQSNVDGQMLITAFLSDRARPQEIQFLKDMKALGGVCWAICDRAGDGLDTIADYVLEIGSGLSELARLPLYLPAVQYMAHTRALAAGLNPDLPRNLSYWVETAGERDPYA